MACRQLSDHLNAYLKIWEYVYIHLRTTGICTTHRLLFQAAACTTCVLYKLHDPLSRRISSATYVGQLISLGFLAKNVKGQIRNSSHGILDVQMMWLFVVHTSFRCKHCIFVWAGCVDPQSVAVTAQFILREAKVTSHFILAQKKKMDGCAHEEIIDSNLFFVASVILF